LLSLSFLIYEHMYSPTHNETPDFRPWLHDPRIPPFLASAPKHLRWSQFQLESH